MTSTREIVLHTERCKACEYCIHFCSQDAIDLTNNFNKMGYKTIAIDEEECIGCGVCYTMCPESVIEIFNEKNTEGSGL